MLAKTPKLDLATFVEWLRMQDPNEEYEYCDFYVCPNARFHAYCGETKYPINGPLSKDAKIIEALAHDSIRTYGALLQHTEAYLEGKLRLPTTIIELYGPSA